MNLEEQGVDPDGHGTADAALRPHVLCFIDDEPDRLDGPTRPIREGSTIRIVQAVSGG